MISRRNTPYTIIRWLCGECDLSATFMGELKPLYLYRLHLLTGASRFYAPDNNIVRYLERRGLIQRTGRKHAAQLREEFEITDAGRAIYEASISKRD